MIDDMHEENKILAELRALAVRQTFFGTLVVDPRKVVVTQADGKRALAAVKLLDHKARTT